MEVFDFDYHSCTAKYPETGERLQLGKSYVFSAAPVAPDARILTLSFEAMFYYSNPLTGAPDAARNTKLNMWRLELFYQSHKLWKRFEYTHPIYGLLICTFNRPLETPKPDKSASRGQTEGFTLEFLEHP